MSADAENTSELADRLSDAIRESRDFARAAYGYDFDQARRNIPLDASGLEIDRLKDPYALDFLGLEPLPGDPTIEDMERTSAVDYLPEPEEIELECSRKNGDVVYAASSWMCLNPSSYSCGVK